MKPYIKGLYNQLNELQLKIKAYQTKCQHPDTLKTAMANTGNYDPNDNRYWYECKCNDCNKFWTEDQ